MFWMKVVSTIASKRWNFFAGFVASALSAVARDRTEPASTVAAWSTQNVPGALPALLASAARAASTSAGSAARATSITMSLGGEIAKKVRLFARLWSLHNASTSLWQAYQGIWIARPARNQAMETSQASA